MVNWTLQRRQCSSSSAVSSNIKAAAAESNIYSLDLQIKQAATQTPGELVGLCRTGDAPGGEGHSGDSSQFGLARCDLEALQLHGEAHVAGDLQLPLEESLGTQAEVEVRGWGCDD